MGVKEGSTNQKESQSFYTIGTDPVKNYDEWFDIEDISRTPVPIAFKLNPITDLMTERNLATSTEYGIDEAYKFDAPAMVAAFNKYMPKYCKLILKIPGGCPLGNIKGIYYRDFLFQTYKYKLLKQFLFSCFKFLHNSSAQSC